MVFAPPGCGDVSECCSEARPSFRVLPSSTSPLLVFAGSVLRLTSAFGGEEVPEWEQVLSMIDTNGGKVLEILDMWSDQMITYMDV